MKTTTKGILFLYRSFKDFNTGYLPTANPVVSIQALCPLYKTLKAVSKYGC